MERNYMKSDVLVELDFITEQHVAFHSHENFELLFVISGKMTVTVAEDTWQLNPGDMLVVNINRKHSYDGSADLVAGRFLISYTKVRELLGQTHVLFWCNSTIDHNEAYEKLRRVIAGIFNQFLSRMERNKLYLSSMYYQMLHLLTENFLLTANDRQYEVDSGKNDDRIQKVFEYIRANYRQNITLEDIANHLYLSPMYVSKFIKQRCNINFSELLNTVRLNRSMEDLIYSDESIMKIALENGFASVAAYNKVFKEAYKMTPSEFRKQKKFSQTEANEQEQKERLLIEKKIEEYLDGNPDVQDEGRSQLTAKIDMEKDGTARWDGYCCKMINAGTAMELLNSSVQEQILLRRNLMGFEYVRFWDIYAPELYMDIHVHGDKQNYSRLNRVIDFLVKNHLKPYIELGFKPVRILKTAHSAVKEIKRERQFASESEMREFYSDLMLNFINRYGSKEVKSWYFEYWENTNVNFQMLSTYDYSMVAEADHRAYFRNFSIIAKAFRERLPGVQIGGSGFPVRLYKENGFTQILTAWKQESQKPDFISLNCYPYIQEKEADAYYEKRTTDFEFVLYNIDMAKNAMKKADFPNVPIHVTEYSLSLSNRNLINDSCLKGAFLVYNAIRCLGKVEVMGHWLFSDIHADEQDTKEPLFGGCGVVTKDNIAKPAYYAIEFLNELYPQILQTHSNYIVTRSDRGSVRIVCHNMKKPNYNFYMAEEDSFQIKDMSVILEDREPMAIHLEIDRIKDGIYIVKKNRVNQNHGSVQNKWDELNLTSNLTMREMEYLKSVSVSALSIQQMEVKENRLEFDVELEPNEILYIHIQMK